MQKDQADNPSILSAILRHHRAAFGPPVTRRFSAGVQQIWTDAANLRLEGRKEPVIGLQRHPLINPIFGSILFFLSWKKNLSVSFAGQNLHLVLPILTGASRYFSDI
jgi:hypothetical protein